LHRRRSVGRSDGKDRLARRIDDREGRRQGLRLVLVLFECGDTRFQRRELRAGGICTGRLCLRRPAEQAAGHEADAEHRQSLKTAEPAS
jgi:hypothetical protein